MERHYPQILQNEMGAMKNYDSTTKKAADICGASQGASEAAQRAEPVGREER